MDLIVRKAQRSNQMLRLLLRGYSGSGKTYSSLVIAKEIVKELDNGQIYYIDTENGSSELYATDFDFNVVDYLVNFGEDFNPRNLINVIKQIEDPNTVIIIDSLSHFWDGNNGILDLQAAAGGTFADWKKVNPLYNEFLHSIIRSKSHVISCARTKTDYAMVEVGGKAKVKKMGTKTISRDGLDYEFTTVLDVRDGGFCESDKDRSSLIPPEGTQINGKLAQQFIKWLKEGIPTEFYANIDELARLSKRTRQDVVDSMLKEYKVPSPDHLKIEQVHDIIEKTKKFIDEIYERHNKKLREQETRAERMLELMEQYSKINGMTIEQTHETILRAANVPLTDDRLADVKRMSEAHFTQWQKIMTDQIAKVNEDLPDPDKVVDDMDKQQPSKKPKKAKSDAKTK